MSFIFSAPQAVYAQSEDVLAMVSYVKILWMNGDEWGLMDVVRILFIPISEWV